MPMKPQCRGGRAVRCALSLAGSLIAAFPAWGWDPATLAAPPVANNSRPATADAHPLYDDILAARINRSEQEYNDSQGHGGLAVHWGQSSDLATAALDASSLVGALGWRVHSDLGWITPWAEVSYQRELRDDASYPLPARENNHWMDLTFGAHLPLSQDLSAFATFSQNGGGPVNGSEQTLYNVGISARF